MPRLPATLRRVANTVSADVARRVGDRLEPVIEGRLSAVSDRLHDELRAEMLELARMLRQQGDADDEVAEILGRSLARLGGEVELLAGALDRIGARADGTAPQPAAPGE